MVGVSKKAIMYYQDVGLLQPSEIKANGYRYYINQDMITLQKIIVMKRLGISIKEMKSKMEHADANDLAESLQKQVVFIEEEIFSCWMPDKNVSRYMWWKASDDINEAKGFVEFELGNLENDKWNRWIIALKSTNEIIGTCLIFFNDDEGHWDISYNLGKKFWSNGYMTGYLHKKEGCFPKISCFGQERALFSYICMKME